MDTFCTQVRKTKETELIKRLYPAFPYGLTDKIAKEYDLPPILLSLQFRDHIYLQEV